MSKHTPGPWSVEMPFADSIDELPVITAHDGKTLVAEILQPLTDEEGDWRGNYDAQLIAAAPDLLAACHSALALLRLISPLLPGPVAGAPETFAQLVQAIARAVGDEQRHHV